MTALARKAQRIAHRMNTGWSRHSNLRRIIRDESYTLPNWTQGNQGAAHDSREYYRYCVNQAKTRQKSNLNNCDWGVFWSDYYSAWMILPTDTTDLGPEEKRQYFYDAHSDTHFYYLLDRA